MAISKDLFLAILAMDSYNRGYNAGIGPIGVGLGLTGQIGNATIGINSNALDQPGLIDRDQAASFYAQSYSLNIASPTGDGPVTQQTLYSIATAHKPSNWLLCSP